MNRRKFLTLLPVMFSGSLHFTGSVAADDSAKAARAGDAMTLSFNGGTYVYRWAKAGQYYGKAAGPAMSDWLKSNGPQVETALKVWDRGPAATALKKLPPRN